MLCNFMVDTLMTRTYTELISLPTFEQRFEYLKLKGRVGEDTFGFDRWINQHFYQRSPEWKTVRNQVIIRDLGRDLGVEGHEIDGKVIVHHMNPIQPKDLGNDISLLLNPEYLITVSHRTHNAIHYGDAKLLDSVLVERKPGDTSPWKH